MNPTAWVYQSLPSHTSCLSHVYVPKCAHIYTWKAQEKDTGKGEFPSVDRFHKPIFWSWGHLADLGTKKVGAIVL